MSRRSKLRTWVVALVAALAVVVGGIGIAFADAGDVPTHTKSLKDNHDGTYTLSLDVVGEAEKKPNNVNVIVIFDTSGSMNSTRMSAAKNAVNSLANSLYAYNTSSEPDTVEMALVQFATSSRVAQQPTNSSSTFRTTVNGLGNQGNGGTNWESALQTANGVNFNDNDQTFVVFVSDGNPTFRTSQNGWNDWSTQYQQWGTGQETTQNIQRCYTTAVDDARTLATKVTPGNFFTIGAFGNVDRMEQLTDDAGSDSSTNYYSASDTAALNQAIADILAKIEMSGIGNAEIDDGTTNQVTTSSGEVAELLELVPNFKYYRSGGSYGTMTPWADAPEAKVVNGEVVWDLSDEGVLENGVRYTVTFDCYPSQTTYDTIAQLKNGDIKYSDLDSEIQKYIVDNGDGSYSLRTNTDASIKWDDTRDDEGRQESAYKNPDPVKTDAETLKASKEWEGGDPDVDELDITVLMDGKPFHSATINKDNDWETESFISIGIIKDGQVLSGAEGHDFEFAELGDEQYHWELESPVVHPMLIDGTVTMLIKVKDGEVAPSGATTYTINGSTYYVDSSVAGLTATNHRRSNLNLTKTVTGEDAPKDATFPFTLTVNNSKAPATEPTNDPDHNSDYWVWFSIYDTKAGKNVNDDVVSNATRSVDDKTGDYYYYAPSGTPISVQMKDGWNLRFTNLPTNTTYTFEESLPEESSFAFKSAELTQGDDSTFSGSQTTKGTIKNTKTSYQVEYTNDYKLTDVEITKKWDDGGNQDGMRPTAEEFKSNLVLKANGTDVTSASSSKLTVTDNEDNTYTAKWTGLDRFAGGEEITYTVEETAIEGYTTTDSPAKDHGTITNTHTPEVVNIPVEKVWKGPKGNAVTVTLYVDGKASENTVTLNADNSWKGSFENLPKNAGGKKIEYTVVEAGVSGVDASKYTTTVTGDADAGFVITNTNTEVVDVTVTKAWDDASNQDGIRPDSLTLTLNGAPEGTTVSDPTITKDGNNWAYKWTGLPKFTEDGNEIQYTVTEGTIPEGYTCDTTTVNAGGTITNKHVPEETEATVKKVWADNNDADKVRPTKIKVSLLKAVGDVVSKVADYDLTAGDDDSWSMTVSGLAKYENGNEIAYSWQEELDKALDGVYSLTHTVVKGNVTTFTNSHVTLDTKTDAILKKTVVSEGNAWETKTFDFTIAAVDGAPMPANSKGSATFTKADTQTIDFGKITYTKAGTYKYTVKETTESGNGWTCDNAEHEVVVTVTDDGSGNLTAAVEPVEIINTYDVKSTTASFPVKKVLSVPEGLKGPASWSYAIDVEAQGDAPEAETMAGTVTNESDTATFGPITYAAPGTYTYKVTETGDIKGVKNDDAASKGKTVTVTVVDNGDGSLTATADSTADEPLTFTNTYGASDATTAPLEAEKTVVNFPIAKLYDEELRTGQFSFKVTDDKTGEVVLSGSNDKNGKVDFGSLTYTEPGTHTYTVTEVKGDATYITYDTETSYKVTITVEDNGEGKLVATVDTHGKTLGFENVYNASNVIELSAKKTLEGRVLEDGQFTFTLTGENDGVSLTAKNDAGGSVTFPEITYDVSKIPDEAWTYAEPADASATDEVATNDEAPAADEGSSDETMTDGTDAAATDDAAINDEAPATDEATADGQGDAEESKPAAKRTAKFVYTISEVNDGNAGYTYDDASFTVTVTVEDDGQGNLTVTDDCPEDLEFVNTYVASGSYTPEVTKMLEGKDLAEGQYSFTLTDEEGNEYTATNAADGTVTFDALSYDQDDAGKTFTYTIKETAGDERFVAYDGHTETLTVTVTDNGDGTLTCEGAYSDGGEFINTYHKPAVGLEVTKTVTSKPSNGKYYRAGETVEYKIVVTNTGEMELYDVKVDDELTGDHWTVDVLAAGGSESFTTSYKVTKADVKAGSVLNVVTAEAENPVDPDKPLKDKDKVEVPTGSEKTPPTPPRKKVIPQTGDETPTGAMAALTVFGAAALTAGTVLQRRKRK